MINFILIFILMSCSLKKSTDQNRQVRLLDGHRREQHESFAKSNMIASQGKHTTEAGLLMFKSGGNIIDAAVASSFAISVERPHSTGIGGGGFLLFYEYAKKKVHVFDFREMAPLKSNEKMYLDKDGNVISDLSLDGGLAVAVPGLVAGLYEIHKKWGKLPWATVMRPAIELAEKGFPMYSYLIDAIKDRESVLRKDQDMLSVFFDAKGSILPVGSLVIQKDLARTLKIIASKGRSGFYDGDIAQKITQDVNSRGGILSLNDFKNYQVKKRQPVEGNFKGYRVISMPPPSSGGVHVIEILNLLENLKFDQPPRSADSIHKIATAMQIAFSDRAKYMGDPDFISVPTKMLISKEYANKFKKFFNGKKIPSHLLAATEPWSEPDSTTHFSLSDAHNNLVVSTQTINGYFGSGMMARGTGVIMNNEMDDFASKVGASNLFGAIGGKNNLIAPKKRPLSSMSPTIVLKGDEPFMALGTPSGTRIINCVAQTIHNVLEFQLPLYDAVSLTRIHHQWSPDVIQVEDPFVSSEVIQDLKNRGHAVVKKRLGCQIQAIKKQDGQWIGVADPRGEGLAKGL